MIEVSPPHDGDFTSCVEAILRCTGAMSPTGDSGIRARPGRPTTIDLSTSEPRTSATSYSPMVPPAHTASAAARFVAAGEHRQPIEEEPFLLSDQLVQSHVQRSQRPMTFQPDPSGPPQQPEAFVDMCKQIGRGEQTDHEPRPTRWRAGSRRGAGKPR